MAGLAARPYDLRHGYASPAFNLGLPPTMIAKRLGHSVDMLLTVYTHWSDNNDAEANRLLGASLEKGGPITGQLLENTPEKPQNPSSKN